MKQIPNQTRRRLGPVAAISVLVPLLLPMLLTGCAAPAATPATPTPAPTESEEATPAERDAIGDSAPGTAGTAELMMAGESMSFELRHCAVTDDELLAGGPGVGNEDGEPAYLDVDVVVGHGAASGGARVELGTDEPFVTLDSFYQLSVGTGDDHSLSIGDDAFTLEGTVRFQGENELGPGTFTVTCGRA